MGISDPHKEWLLSAWCFVLRWCLQEADAHVPSALSSAALPGRRRHPPTVIPPSRAHTTGARSARLGQGGPCPPAGEQINQLRGSRVTELCSPVRVELLTVHAKQAVPKIMTSSERSQPSKDSTVSSLYLWVPHPWVQPTGDRKYLGGKKKPTKKQNMFQNKFQKQNKFRKAKHEFAGAQYDSESI